MNYLTLKSKRPVWGTLYMHTSKHTQTHTKREDEYLQTMIMSMCIQAKLNFIMHIKIKNSYILVIHCIIISANGALQNTQNNKHSILNIICRMGNSSENISRVFCRETKEEKRIYQNPFWSSGYWILEKHPSRGCPAEGFKAGNDAVSFRLSQQFGSDVIDPSPRLA